MPRFFISTMIIGFGALIWGLFSLLQIIKQERSEALESLKFKQIDINFRVNKRFRQLIKVNSRQAREKINRALQEPLENDHEILLYLNSKLVLPRKAANKKQKSSSISLYNKLIAREYHLINSKDHEEWKKRLNLFKVFVKAIQSKERNKIIFWLRQILAHRNIEIIDARKDIAYMIALLEYFDKNRSPNSKLMKALLVEGLRDGNGETVLDLQRLIIKKRNRLSQKEFDYFANKILALSKKYQLATKQFIFRLKKSIIKVPDVNSLKSGHFVQDGLWYIIESDQQSAVGFHFPVEKLVGKIQAELKANGVLHVDDQLLLSSPISKKMDASKIKLIARLYNAEDKEQALHSRYGYKLALILACGIFAFIMIVLAVLHQYRKLRYLKLQADFLAAVSHELRTPLTSIRLLAETLEYRLENISEARDYPSRIVSDIDGLSFLVENILSYNRLQKDFWNLNRTEIELNEILANINKEIHLHCDKKIDIKFIQSESAKFKLEADPELLKLLLINLIKNSSYYNNNENIIIKMEFIKHKGHIILVYKDNGVGINQLNWKKVFKEFYRANTDQTRNIRGSGLGLSICSKIMKLHKGKIWIKHSDDKGSEFNMRF